MVHKRSVAGAAAVLGQAQAQLEALSAIPAVGRRARKGNVPAAKLLLEMAGYHNSKVDHNHSGEVKISINNVARPPREKDVVDIPDADVVEE